MARYLKVPVKLMENFQHNYFLAFPAIQRWHRWVAQQLQQHQRLETPFGRHRHFFGRATDDSTLREAIAFTPQSSTGDRMNLGLYRIWRDMRDRVQLLAQVHDAVYFQFPEHLDEQEICSQALALIDIRLKHGERELIVPGECKVGWNWGNWDAVGNPNGLKKVKKGVKDERRRLPTSTIA
jgi:DNA polymerase I-like protein with 3'-5' exonuclease and polymerase domains